MNQRKLVLYIASSLDGYIATEEHSLDWLFSVEGEGEGDSYARFYETVDTILIGRTTYDWIMKMENGNFPYKGKDCYVFSRTKKEDNEHVTFIHENAVQFTKNLKSKEGKSIWIVGGSELLHTFIQEKLVDELIITIAPVLIGRGIPLFKSTDFQTPLVLKSVNQHKQLVELHYEAVRV